MISTFEIARGKVMARRGVGGDEGRREETGSGGGDFEEDGRI